MMLQQIKKDLVSAQKEKDENKVSTLRMLISAMTNKSINKRADAAGKESGLSEEELAKKGELADQEIIDVIFSEAKKRKEAAIEYEKGNRPELAKKEKLELEILSAYLPAQMGEEEVRKLVIEAIAKTGAKDPKDMGKVMAALMPSTKGKADGTLVSKIVKELLGGK
ncbi:MAG: GatB/YqeY domain-containing protein [Candidatus Paceibacterota bacterium]